MSEQSQGPGWWLASDGRWYPPALRAPALPEAPAAEAAAWVAPGGSPNATPPIWTSTAPYGPGGAHLGLAPSQPPSQPSSQPSSHPAPRHTGRWLLIAGLGVVAVMAVVIVALGTKTEHRSTAAAGSAASAASAAAPLSAADPLSASDAGSAGSTGQIITARNGTISLELPPGWRGADVSTGVAGAGASIFPDDPSAAEQFEQRIAILPRSLVLVGASPTPSAGTVGFDNVSVLFDPTAPVRLSIDEIGPAEARGIAQFASISNQGTVDLGGRRAYRIVYSISAVSGVAFVVKGSDDTWVLTYTFDSKTVDLDAAKASANTFVAP